MKGSMIYRNGNNTYWEITRNNPNQMFVIAKKGNTLIKIPRTKIRTTSLYRNAVLIDNDIQLQEVN